MMTSFSTSSRSSGGPISKSEAAKILRLSKEQKPVAKVKPFLRQGILQTGNEGCLPITFFCKSWNILSLWHFKCGFRACCLAPRGYTSGQVDGVLDS